MRKSLKHLSILLALVLMSAVAGCAHKPAYSDMDVNRNSRNQNKNEGQGGSPLAEALQGSPTQPAPAAESAKPKMPSFMAPNGTVRDLPSYPRSTTISVQIGPIQEADVMTLLLRTGDAMEKVQAFYAQVIKENNWTVADKLIDPEVSEWTLKKDDANNAKVQAKKDPRTGAIEISIIRAEKHPAPPK
jgi:hypothetical protein